MAYERMTCERVDREDLDTRYLAGKLAEPDAEAFEAHFFECDRCWDLVHRGVAVRSGGRPAPVPATEHRSKTAHRWRRLVIWAPLAAAAIVLLWLATRSAELPPALGVDTVVRGDEEAGLPLRSLVSGSQIGAAWSKVARAASYQVRLFDPNGTLLWERRVTDAAVSVARDSLPGGPTGPASGVLYWQVQALDVIGAAVARSALVPTATRP